MRLLRFACALIALAVASGAQAERRLALVIGIDDYLEVPKLEKAVGDAHAIAAALKELGFTVSEVNNIDRRGLNRAIAEFSATISPGDMALVHFSGHGVEIDGENYLLPADTPKPASGGKDFVKAESVALGQLVARIADAGAGTRIFIIDACRDNPFEQVGVRSVGSTRGLARVEAPAGTFIMYSAGYRQTALDSLGPDDGELTSVYTRVLLNHLGRPGTALDDIAQDVREEVETLARGVGHQQRPAYYDELSTRVALLAAEASAGPADPIAPPLTEGPSIDRAEADYAFAAQIGTEAAWSAFLARYGADPGNFYVQLAIAARQKLAVLEQDESAEAPPPDDCEGGVVASVSGPGTTTTSESCLKPGDTFRDCERCPEMVVIPAGNFLMGSPLQEGWREEDEGPQHQVTIHAPFAVAKVEVSFDEWYVCEASGNCDTYKPPGLGGRPLIGGRPVIYVSWYDALAYVTWLSQRAGVAYRLLTEAEWEYAARAGTVTPFSTGTTITADQANFDGTFLGDGRFLGSSTDVGSYASNAFGLHDMHGNAMEWVEDCYHANYTGAPANGSAWITAECSFRVVRGGSWRFQGPSLLRSAYRGGFDPRTRNDSIGFRVARALGGH